MGRASRKRASKRAGTYVDPHPPAAKKTKPAPPPRQPFTWATAKNFIIYGVALLLATTLVMSAVPGISGVAGAGAVYLVATAAVLGYQGLNRGWGTIRRPAAICGLIVVGVAAGGWGLTFMKEPLATNPFIGALLGVLLAGSGRVLFPTAGQPKAPA